MFRIIVVICFACVLSGKAFATERIYVKEACVWETFEARCPDSQILFVRKASFGRLRSGRCLNLTSAEKPCYSDVQSFVERHCGGRRDCRIKLTNENLKLSPSNCTMYLPRLLEVEYSCEDAYAAQDQTCVSKQSLLVTTSSGYLANIITDETGQGSQSCPWRFQPQPGQTVHLTLLDFGVWIDRAERDRRNICRIYATIKEIGTAHQKSDTLVCGGVQREKFIMSTDTEITIAVMRQENTVNDTAYFFIKYQVFNCPNFEAPALALVERSGSGIRITCQFNSALVWEIKCVSGSWDLRHTINCPEAATTVSVPPVSPCPDVIPKDGIQVRPAGNGYMAICSDGVSVEFNCVNGAWTPSQTSPCFDTLMSSTQAPPIATSDQLTIIVIVGSASFVVFVIVVIATIVACKKRRASAKKKMNCSMRSHSNSYYTAQLLPDQSADRVRSGIYDTLDESRMQDAEPTPLPCTSSCNQGSPRCAMTLQPNQKLEPWTNASMERRSGTLPVHRPLPEPHEYTTPIKRDSTYLMPREPVYLNPVVVVDDAAKEKV